MLDFVQSHFSGRAIDICEDNEGAKALAETSQGSHRSKRKDVHFYFLRGFLRLGLVIIRNVVSTEQHADTLTNSLGREAFRRHREFLTNLS